MTGNSGALQRGKRIRIGVALATLLWAAGAWQQASAEDQDANILGYYQNGSYTVSEVVLKWKPPGQNAESKSYKKGLTAGMSFCFDVNAYNKNQCRQNKNVKDLTSEEKDAICKYPAKKPSEPAADAENYEQAMESYQQAVQNYEAAKKYAGIPDQSELWIVVKIDAGDSESCKKDRAIVYNISSQEKKVLWRTDGSTFNNNRCKKAKSWTTVSVGSSLGNCEYSDYRY